MDQRTRIEKRLWELVGPPLYYCSDCLRAVKVEPRDGAEPVITRPCGDDCGQGIIAPRKAIVTGDGGLSIGDRVKQTYWQAGAALTGRCV